MTIKDLLWKLEEERQELFDEELRCDKEYSRCRILDDQEGAEHWIRKSRTAYAKGAEIAKAISIIKERVS